MSADRTKHNKCGIALMITWKAEKKIGIAQWNASDA